MNTSAQIDNGPVALSELVDLVCQKIQEGAEVDIGQLEREFPGYADKVAGMVRILKDLHTFDLSLTGDRPGSSVQPADMIGRLGDFRLLGPIGRGGMGIVYEAAQVSIDRRVALKVLPLTALIDDLALKRFRNEVQAAALIEHPNIVAVYSVGEDRGVHYYAMQLVRGPSLASVIGSLKDQLAQDGFFDGDTIRQIVSRHRWPVAEAMGSTSAEGSNSTARAGGPPACPVESSARGRFGADYFRCVAQLGVQAARALDEAHLHGVIHRDIKPGNLLLDSHGSLFVADFGLARIETAQGITNAGDVMGTLRYMSPEQVTGEKGIVDARTDQYSLGATLYELAALRPMYDGTGRTGLIRGILDGEPESLRRIRPAVPPDLATIIGKATRKDAGERYPRCGDLADDLQRFLDNRPILARNPTLVNRIAKWSQRNPLLVKAGLAGFVLATIGLIISNLLILEQKRIAEEKTREAQRLQRKSDELAASETKARVRAEELNTQTSEYNNILQGIFSDLNPRDKKPGDPELAQLLADRLVLAGEQIGKNNYQWPVKQIELLLELGSSLTSLGYPEQALKIYERADQIIADNAQSSEPFWVALKSTYVGSACLACGKPDLAAVAYQRGYDYYQISDPEGKETLSCLHGLATAQYQSGDYRGCIASLESLIPRRIRVLGESHKSTLTSMNVLAAAYQANGELDLALEWMERVYKLRCETLGPDSLDANTSRNNLANLLRGMGDDERAVTLLQEASVIMEKLVGTDHPDYNAVQVNLATTLRNLGRGEEALAILRPAIERMNVRPGKDHPRTIAARFALGNLLGTLNQMEESIPVLRECLDAYVKIETETGPSALIARLTLAEKLIAAGQSEEGLQLAKAARDQAAVALGPGHPTTNNARLALARGLILTGDSRGAIALLEEAIASVDPKQAAASSRDQLLIKTELATACRTVGENERSRDMLREVLAATADRLRPGHPQLVSLYADLALVSMNLQEWDEARQAQENWEQHLSINDHPWYHGHLELQKSLLAMHTDPSTTRYTEILAGCEKIKGDLSRLNKLNQFPLRELALNVQSAMDKLEPSPELDSARQAVSELLAAME